MHTPKLEPKQFMVKQVTGVASQGSGLTVGKKQRKNLTPVNAHTPTPYTRWQGRTCRRTKVLSPMKPFSLVCVVVRQSTNVPARLGSLKYRRANARTHDPYSYMDVWSRVVAGYSDSPVGRFIVLTCGIVKAQEILRTEPGRLGHYL